MFRDVYASELRYVRQLLERFGQEHPSLAALVAGSQADDDVERLSQGVAFLTGRVRERLDDELPEIAHPIIETLFPQLVLPLPGLSILQFTPASNLRTAHTVVAGAEFASARDGMVFRSTRECELFPWKVEELRVLEQLGGGCDLVLAIAATSGVSLDKLAPNSIRFHVAMDDIGTSLNVVAAIWELAGSVHLVAQSSGGASARPVLLPKRAVSLVGFAPGDRLLPTESDGFPAFRMLQEYLILPEKFSFLDVSGLEKLREMGAGITRFEIHFKLARDFPELNLLRADDFRLHCVPIVNVFSTTSEPITISPNRREHAVIPSDSRRCEVVCYSVQSVSMMDRKAGGRTVLSSAGDVFQRSPGPSNVPSYRTARRPALVGDGVEVTLALDDRADPIDPGTTISVQMLATNGYSPGKLGLGEVCVPTPSSPPLASFGNIRQFTPPAPSVISRDLSWRFLAYAIPNPWALAQADVFRSLMQLLDLPALFDERAASRARERSQGLTSLRCEKVDRLVHGQAQRGIHVTAMVEPLAYYSRGGAMLFGDILSRLFAESVEQGFCSQFTLYSASGELLFDYGVRGGQRPA